MRYPSRDEAIAREIVAPIEAGDASAAEYDIDAIADATLTWRVDRDAAGNELLNTAGFETTVIPEEFWPIVAANAR